MAMLARGGVELYYDSVGDGAPLLLIVGLASDSLSWQPIIGELAAHYRVITDAAHSIHMENPQALVKHVIDFLPPR